MVSRMPSPVRPAAALFSSLAAEQQPQNDEQDDQAAYADTHPHWLSSLC
jgi:hypothetical protein